MSLMMEMIRNLGLDFWVLLTEMRSIVIMAITIATLARPVESGTCSPDNPMKRQIPCNGHGECNTRYGICICAAGWSGFNCSHPDTPCEGEVLLFSKALCYVFWWLRVNHTRH